MVKIWQLKPKGVPQKENYPEIFQTLATILVFYEMLNVIDHSLYISIYHKLFFIITLLP